jgi:hypothetical protein
MAAATSQVQAGMSGFGQDTERVRQEADDEFEGGQADGGDDGTESSGAFIFSGFLVCHGSLSNRSDYNAGNASLMQDDECLILPYNDGRIEIQFSV